MSIFSFPYTSISGDRGITASQYRTFVKSFTGDGVLRNGPGLMALTRSGMNATIGLGAAMINGTFAMVTSPETFAITAISTARYASIVLEFNDNSGRRDTILKVLYGSSTTPAATTQNSTVYQMRLYDILVPANASTLEGATVYDRRVYAQAVDYTLPVATPYTLGGVRPAAKTEEMTQPVGSDAAGNLWTKPGESGGESGSTPAASPIGLSVFYGSCLTNGGDSAKVVTCDSDFALDEKGPFLLAYFQNAQTHDATTENPVTINVNGLGAYPVMRRGGVPAGRGAWKAYEIVGLVFTGSAWYMTGGSVVDSQLSANSTNPLENRAIYSLIGNLETDLASLR